MEKGCFGAVKKEVESEKERMLEGEEGVYSKTGLTLLVADAVQ